MLETPRAPSSPIEPARHDQPLGNDDFVERLRESQRRQRSLLCVGLDPDPSRLPVALQRERDGIARFCIEIVDATAAAACAFKPQIAYFAAAGAESQLEAVIDHIHRHHPELPVILDAKRGDIGATAEQYAREAFDRYRADAITVNPYMGGDSIAPYLKHPGRGVFVLCRTSNPGGDDLQALLTAGATAAPLYQRVARLASEEWNSTGQLGLVVGATYPTELAHVRRLVGDMPLLVPGIGAQGGDIDATVGAGLDSHGAGMLINSSRAILYASAGEDFASAARAVAHATRDAIERARARQLAGH